MTRPFLQIRRSVDLGSTRKGPLEGIHHFSFASFQKPDWIDWGLLRAVHRYRLAAGCERKPVHYSGFDVLTVVESGTLRRIGSFEPKESLVPRSIELVATGSGALLGQLAGRSDDAVFTEIWLKSPDLLPARRSCATFSKALPHTVLASPAGLGGALSLSCQASIERALLQTGERRTLMHRDTQRSYIVIVSGSGNITGELVEAGDAIAMWKVQAEYHAHAPSELIIVHC